MTTKKKIPFNSITFGVDGIVLGKISKWDPKEICLLKKDTPVLDVVSSHPSPTQGESTLNISKGLKDLWKQHIFPSTRKSTFERELPQHSTHPDADLILKAQLEMWGIDKDGKISIMCLEKLIQLIEDLDYVWWVDADSSFYHDNDDEWIAETGVSRQEIKFEYIPRKEESSQLPRPKGRGLKELG